MRTVVPHPGDDSMKILAPVEMLAVRLVAPVASAWLALGFAPARYVSIHYRSTHEREQGIGSDPHSVKRRRGLDRDQGNCGASVVVRFAGTYAMRHGAMML
jgi:hypothetical protein